MRVQPGGAWDLPGTATAWALPLIVPWLALIDLGFDASVRAFTVLGTGTAGIAAMLAIGVWAARHSGRVGDSKGRRVVLWSFLATSCSLGLATLWLSETTAFPMVSLAPMLTWLLSTFLLPLWRDDDTVVDPREPATGWKRLFGMRMVYSDGGNPAVWVRMRSPIPSTDIGYTPNLGHFWGRLTIVMFFASLLMGMAVSVAAWAR
ncbi:MAG TPA: hypothetical protein VGH38_34400 [Bryobacteraceae bacterium]|jgi:hypothetical protein